MSSSSSVVAAAPSVGFREFLSRRPLDRLDLDDEHDDAVYHAFVGNEAGDADSIVSALAAAWYVENDASSSSDELRRVVVVPLVSVPRADVVLRRDACLLLEDLCGVDLARLSYVDDEPVRRLLTSDRLRRENRVVLTLTDHNVVDDRSLLAGLPVVGVLDHHEDAGRYADAIDREVAYANGEAAVASACTLVAERALSSSSSLDPDAALALLGVVALDSVGLDEAAGRATDRDRRAVRALLDSASWEGRARPDPVELFRTLSGARTDPAFWRSLSSEDVLRIDFKSFVTERGRRPFGLSTVMLSTTELLSPSSSPDFVADAVAWARTRGLDLLGVMSCSLSSTDGSLERRLLLLGDDPSIVAIAADFLTREEHSLELREEEIAESQPTTNAAAVRSFAQGNAKASRKRMAPILTKCEWGEPTGRGEGETETTCS